jgi:hypothetical protein
MNRFLRSSSQLFCPTVIMFIGASLTVGHAHANVGIIYTSRSEWLAATNATLYLHENFESLSPGWNNTPAIRSWGRIESASTNPYGLWIENGISVMPTKSLQTGSPIHTLRPNNQSAPLGAFGFDYIGPPELKLFDLSGQHFTTIEPAPVFAFQPARFFGWLAAPGQTLSKFTMISLSGHSLMDNLTFGFGVVPEPSSFVLLCSAWLPWGWRRGRRPRL